MEPGASNAVNHGVSCDSENSVGRALGRMAVDGASIVERAILEMFLTLDDEGRMRVFEALAKLTEAGVS